jgi:hypothetical protein
MKYTLALLSLVSSISVAAEQQQFQTTPGDSLSYILRSQNYGETYADIYPYIAEVLRLNPHAFRDGNPNFIVPDVMLTLPVNPNAVEPVPEPEPELVAAPAPELSPEPVAAPAPEPAPEPESTAAIIGSIEVGRGFSEIIRDTKVITVTQAENLYVTDVIFTPGNTRAEIRFIDDTRITMGPESRFELNEFSYSGNQSLDAVSQDSLVATLHRGVFSIVTGLVAQNKNNRIDFRSALTTSIGILGTDFTVRTCMEQVHCGDLYGVSAAVKAGGISLKNAVAEITLNKNEFAQIKNTTDAPAKAPLPEGFYDLDLDVSKIEMNSSWWQQTLDWFSAYF